MTQNALVIANGSKAQIVNTALDTTTKVASSTVGILTIAGITAGATAIPTMGISIAAAILISGIAVWIQAQNRKNAELQNVLALVASLCFTMTKNLSRMSVQIERFNLNLPTAEKITNLTTISPSFAPLEKKIEILLKDMLQLAGPDSIDQFSAQFTKSNSGNTDAREMLKNIQSQGRVAQIGRRFRTFFASAEYYRQVIRDITIVGLFFSLVLSDYTLFKDEHFPPMSGSELNELIEIQIRKVKETVVRQVTIEKLHAAADKAVQIPQETESEHHQHLHETATHASHSADEAVIQNGQGWHVNVNPTFVRGGKRLATRARV